MAENSMIKKYYTVPRAEIGYMRFTFEGYDGLIFMRTLRAADGLIEIAYPPGLRDDAEALLAALELEVALTATGPPPAEEYAAI